MLSEPAIGCNKANGVWISTLSPVGERIVPIRDVERGFDWFQSPLSTLLATLDATLFQRGEGKIKLPLA